ncbi:hypothetical protein ACZ90_28295 [Streptomyces albus subsp. albus]|nr:hypothetical protein ACZ90_28295 [Streptomyces albus subsp. albus]
MVAVLALMLVGGWLLTRDEDSAPLAGRPRVTDEAAGVSYAIPEGWRHRKGDLSDHYTSSLAGKHLGGEGGGMVLAGRYGAVPEHALKREAERKARTNAEIFCHDGSSTLVESRATKVSGRPAHTVVVKPGCEEATGHLRLTLVTVDRSRSAFLVGIAESEEQGERPVVDLVLESAAVI